jgi:hypothetical protein
MSDRFPHKCARCGYCCLVTVCPISRRLYGVPKGTLCPALSFDHEGKASCALAPNVVPVGDGCCIKARAYKGGKVYDFAGLPTGIKRRAVSDLVRQFI